MSGHRWSMRRRSATRLARVGRRWMLKPCWAAPSSPTSRPETAPTSGQPVERVGQPGDGAGRRRGVRVEEQEARRAGGLAGRVDAAGESAIALERDHGCMRRHRPGPGRAAVGGGVVGDNDLGFCRIDRRQAPLEPGRGLPADDEGPTPTGPARAALYLLAAALSRAAAGRPLGRAACVSRRWARRGVRTRAASFGGRGLMRGRGPPFGRAACVSRRWARRGVRTRAASVGVGLSRPTGDTM